MVMAEQDLVLLTVLTKYVLLPSAGFCAGFLAKWFLQERKSRDDLLEALADSRAAALRDLWTITTLRPEIAGLEDEVTLPSEFLEQANADVMEWYTKQGGALFLSWQATNLVFRLLDVLRDKNASKGQLKKAVSALRTRLKRDCGIYSYWDVKRQLSDPRGSPWPVATAVETPKLKFGVNS
jgi:hypothetical protein